MNDKTQLYFEIVFKYILHIYIHSLLLLTIANSENKSAQTTYSK